MNLAEKNEEFRVAMSPLENRIVPLIRAISNEIELEPPVLVAPVLSSVLASTLEELRKVVTPTLFTAIAEKVLAQLQEVIIPE